MTMGWSAFGDDVSPLAPVADVSNPLLAKRRGSVRMDELKVFFELGEPESTGHARRYGATAAK
jgi:hypothetical protein